MMTVSNDRNGSKADIGAATVRSMKCACLSITLVASLSACSSHSPVSLQCHQVTPAWDVAEAHLRPVHRIALTDAGSLTFDGKPATAAEIRSRLNEAMWRDTFSPVVAYERSPTQHCTGVGVVRRLMADTLACREGQCMEVEPPPTN
jgi:hypothetical protein